MEHFNIALLCEKEPKPTGTRHFVQKHSFRIFCSGNIKLRRNCLALIMGWHVAQAVRDWNAKCDQIISVRLHGKHISIIIIQL